MKKGLKWALWMVMILIIGGIVLNFYLNYFKLAYALMVVLFLVISGWGAVLKVKNEVNWYTDQGIGKSEIDEIERYTR